MGSKESEASGVKGDGERDPVAVVDDADIVDDECQVICVETFVNVRVF
jgi:hypothetical protein